MKIKIKSNDMSLLGDQVKLDQLYFELLKKFNVRFQVDISGDEDLNGNNKELKFRCSERFIPYAAQIIIYDKLLNKYSLV